MLENEHNSIRVNLSLTKSHGQINPYFFDKRIYVDYECVCHCICSFFIQRCFTFMDRGFVFKQINNYMNCFVPGDPKVLKGCCYLSFHHV